MAQAKNWTFTLNGYEALCDFDEPEAEFVTFAIYQEEVGLSGTPHLQGYLQCDRRVRLSQLQAVPSLAGAHFEVARGSLADNVSYCSKEEGRLGGPYEYGEARGAQGTRSDLLAVKRTVDDGADLTGLYEQHFAHMIRYGKSILNYKRFRATPRTAPPCVFLFVGIAGSGKSRTAFTLAQMLGSVYFVPPTKGSGLYWDDYDQQTCVILDEFDGNRCTPTFLNSLCDRYPFEVPVHGNAGRAFNSPYIFIVSNYMPKYWWKTKPNLDPLFRRVSVYRLFVRYSLPPLSDRPVVAEDQRVVRYNGVPTPFQLLFSL